MVAIAPEALPETLSGDDLPSRRWRWRRPRSLTRTVVLVVAAAYFLVPLWAGLHFALHSTYSGWSLSAIRSLPSEGGFSTAFGLSVRLAVVTTVVTLVLILPTAIVVHLKLPRLRRLFDGLTLLPIVVPPVILIVGVLEVAPSFLKATPYLLALEYVVLATPFAYRSIDAGLRALDLGTLVEASRSLGAGWVTTVWRVIVPNLRAALLSATVLTLALVLGEFTMATLDQYQTFPVWIVNFDQDNAQTSVAASLLALLITWAVLLAISMVGARRSSRKAAKEQA